MKTQNEEEMYSLTLNIICIICVRVR